jgi:cadmium resistance protein CadD (predicted permease)
MVAVVVAAIRACPATNIDDLLVMLVLYGQGGRLGTRLDTSNATSSNFIKEL